MINSSLRNFRSDDQSSCECTGLPQDRIATIETPNQSEATSESRYYTASTISNSNPSEAASESAYYTASTIRTPNQSQPIATTYDGRTSPRSPNQSNNPSDEISRLLIRERVNIENIQSSLNQVTNEITTFIHNFANHTSGVRENELERILEMLRVRDHNIQVQNRLINNIYPFSQTEENENRSFNANERLNTTGDERDELQQIQSFLNEIDNEILNFLLDAPNLSVERRENARESIDIAIRERENFIELQRDLMYRRCMEGATGSNQCQVRPTASSGSRSRLSSSPERNLNPRTPERASPVNRSGEGRDALQVIENWLNEVHREIHTFIANVSNYTPNRRNNARERIVKAIRNREYLVHLQNNILNQICEQESFTSLAYLYDDLPLPPNPQGPLSSNTSEHITPGRRGDQMEELVQIQSLISSITADVNNFIRNFNNYTEHQAAVERQRINVAIRVRDNLMRLEMGIINERCMQVQIPPIERPSNQPRSSSSSQQLLNPRTPEYTTLANRTGIPREDLGQIQNWLNELCDDINNFLRNNHTPNSRQNARQRIEQAIGNRVYLTQLRNNIINENGPQTLTSRISSPNKNQAKSNIPLRQVTPANTSGDQMDEVEQTHAWLDEMRNEINNYIRNHPLDGRDNEREQRVNGAILLRDFFMELEIAMLNDRYMRRQVEPMASPNQDQVGPNTTPVGNQYSPQVGTPDEILEEYLDFSRLPRPQSSPIPQSPERSQHSQSSIPRIRFAPESPDVSRGHIRHNATPVPFNMSNFGNNNYSYINPAENQLNDYSTLLDMSQYTLDDGSYINPPAYLSNTSSATSNINNFRENRSLPADQSNASSAPLNMSYLSGDDYNNVTPPGDHSSLSFTGDSFTLPPNLSRKKVTLSGPNNVNVSSFNVNVCIPPLCSTSLKSRPASPINYFPPGNYSNFGNGGPGGASTPQRNESLSDNYLDFRPGRNSTPQHNESLYPSAHTFSGNHSNYSNNRPGRVFSPQCSGNLRRVGGVDRINDLSDSFNIYATPSRVGTPPATPERLSLVSGHNTNPSMITPDIYEEFSNARPSASTAQNSRNLTPSNIHESSTLPLRNSQHSDFIRTPDSYRNFSNVRPPASTAQNSRNITPSNIRETSTLPLRNSQQSAFIRTPDSYRNFSNARPPASTAQNSRNLTPPNIHEASTLPLRNSEGPAFIGTPPRNCRDFSNARPRTYTPRSVQPSRIYTSTDFSSRNFAPTFTLRDLDDLDNLDSATEVIRCPHAQKSG